MTALWQRRLLLDILSMKVFIWMFGRNGELLDSHLFFFDRLSLLAEYHRQKGHTVKAAKLQILADAHFDAAPDDEPPEADEGVMPIPHLTNTNAVSTTSVKERFGGRRSGMAPAPVS